MVNVWTWTHFIQRPGSGASYIGIVRISYVWLGSPDLTSKVSKNNGEDILTRTHWSGPEHGLVRALVQTENGLFPIVIVYDTGSEVSLCNYETGPIVSDTKRGNKKVTISTINSIQAKIRQVYKLTLNDGWSMEAIMIPTMKLQLQAQVIPQAWQDLNGT